MSESGCNVHHRCLQTLGTKQLRLTKLVKGNDFPFCLYYVEQKKKKSPLQLEPLQ